LLLVILIVREKMLVVMRRGGGEWRHGRREGANKHDRSCSRRRVQRHREAQGWRVIFFLVGGVFVIVLHVVVGMVRMLEMGVKRADVRWKRRNKRRGRVLGTVVLRKMTS